MAGHPDPNLVARCVLAANRLFRPAMRMLLVHPITGRPAPTPTPPRVAQMWTELAKMRAMLQQRLVDSKSPSNLRRAITRFLCTIVFAFTERSKESSLRVASAGSRVAAVVVNGPDAFCVSDVPQMHPALQHRELGGIAKALVSSLSVALSSAGTANWDDAALCFLVVQLAWVATVRPTLLPMVAQTLASLVQSPAEGLRPTVSQSRDSLTRRIRPAVAMAVRSALVRLMKRAAAAEFTADLGACLFVMGDEQRPEPLAHAVRARIDFKVVEQLRALQPTPRPDQQQAYTSAFSSDAALDSYSAPNNTALYDLGDEYAPPPSSGTAAPSASAAGLGNKAGQQLDPRLSHSSEAGGDPRSASGQRSAASEQHSCFKSAAPQLSTDALHKMSEAAFARLMQSQSAVQWSASALHSLEGLCSIHQLVAWAVDPWAVQRRGDAAAVCAGTCSKGDDDAEQAVRVRRCEQVMQRVCEDFVECADVGARLLAALWLSSRGDKGRQLLHRLTDAFVAAAVIDSASSKLSPTLVVDVACALPYDCLQSVLRAVQALVQSTEPALLASGFRILDAYRHRRPQHEARLVQFYLCVAHTASSEGAQATAIKALDSAKQHMPYVTQFAVTVALSVARPPGVSGRDASGWKDQSSLLFPHTAAAPLTELEATAAERFAGGVADVHDARRRVSPFFRLCARQHSLLGLVPWLYCNAGGSPEASDSNQVLAGAVRQAITTTQLWLYTLKVLKRKHAVHEVLSRLRFEEGLELAADGTMQVHSEYSVHLPCSTIAGCDVHRSPSFVPFVTHVLQVCTDDLVPEPAPQHIGQWGASINSSTPTASIPVETIQSALRIGAKAGDGSITQELCILQPLLRFLPAADLLALLPHYLAHMADMSLPLHEFLQNFLPPGSSSCSLDPAFFLAWVLQCCSADSPQDLQVWKPPTASSAATIGSTLADAVQAAKSSAFFERYGAATVLPLAVAAKDVQGLMTTHRTFDAPMLWSALGLLAATQPPPKLLMFWFLSAREAFNTDIMSKQLCALLTSFVERANAHGDASAALWQDENTWKGFRKFVLTTIPASLPSMLRLPLPQLEKLVESNPKLKLRLEAFVASQVNQTGVEASILLYLGVQNVTSTRISLAGPIPQAAASDEQTTQGSRVGGRKRSGASLHDSRNSLRPRSD